jgi:capsule polysaccharide export protein KpsC/LpsZ
MENIIGKNELDKFITNRECSFLYPFKKYIDIEYNRNDDIVRNSNKTFIAWNWFTNIDIFSYRKINNLPSICVERGALPGSIFFDLYGFNCLSTSYNRCNWDTPLCDSELQQIKEYIKDYIHESSPEMDLEFQKSNNISKQTLLHNLNCTTYNKIVFVPFQLSTDMVIKHFSGRVKNQNNFIEEIVKLSNLYKDVLFLYKNHPLQKNLNVTTNNLICVDDYHFKSCLDLCDIVMCINSGVGLQSMIYNKPCVLFGDAFYTITGVNYDYYSLERDDIFTTDLQFDSEAAYRFLYWLQFKFYSNVRWYSYKNINKSKLEKINTFRIWTENKTHQYT